MSLLNDVHDDLWIRILNMSETDPRVAITFAQQHLARSVGSTAIDWRAQFALGIAFQRAECYSDAAAVLHEAIHGLQQMGDTVLALRAQAYWLIVTPAASHQEPLVKQLAALAHRIYPHDPLASAQISFEIISEYNRTEPINLASDLLMHVEPAVMRYGSPFDRGRFARLEGVIARRRSLWQKALTSFQRAIECYEEIENRNEVARTLFQRVTLYTELEAFPPAREELARAYALFTELQMPIGQAQCQQQSSIIEMRLGRYDRAIEALQYARHLYVAQNHTEMVASCDLELGNIAWFSGLFQLADRLYQQAGEVYEQLGRTNMVAKTLRNRGSVQSSLGNGAAARALFDQAYPLTEEHHSERAELLLSYGMLDRQEATPHADFISTPPNAQQQEQMQQAAARITQARDMFLEKGIAASAGSCHLELAIIALQHGQIERVTELLHRASRELAEQPAMMARVYYTQGQSHELRAMEYERAGQERERRYWRRAALTSYRHAIDAVYQMRRHLLVEQASSRILHSNEHMFTAAYRLACACDDAVAVLRIAEQHSGITLANRLSQVSPDVAPIIKPQLDRASQRITILLEQQASPKVLQEAMDEYFSVLFRSRHSVPVQSVEDTVSDLDDLCAEYTTHFGRDWSVLIYTKIDARTLILLMLTSDDLTLHPIKEHQRLHVRDLGSAYRLEQLLTPTMQPGADNPWQRLDDLSDLLIPDAVRQRLHPGHRLLIVPGGLTNHIPWPALRIGGRWLIEQSVIQIIPSLYSWHYLAKRAAQPRYSAAFVAGVSTFAHAEPINTRESLCVAEKHLGEQATCLQEAQVTTTYMRELSERQHLARYGLLHLATHGSMGAHGEIAHVLLSDGPWLVDDIARLQLSAPLVLLLTCEGATSHNLHDGEVLSLSRAFLVAGAVDIIANQGFIYNDRIVPFLDPLYKALQDGHDAPTALALAQRTMIAMQPVTWGGFTAMGAGIPRTVTS